MTLEKLNALSARDAVTLFRQACGSVRWAEEMTRSRPFTDRDRLTERSDQIWNDLPQEEWKEAFARHPKIGDMKQLRMRFPATAALSEGEQAGLTRTSEKVLKAIAEGNELYEAKFGYIFIVCAAGKSAEEMLSELRRRLDNLPSEEILVASAEQANITQLRLSTLIS
jgi:2-oxo-4-hydroxy-4-carboxy-5-ureidoimidazoline decarboxylase